MINDILKTFSIREQNPGASDGIDFMPGSGDRITVWSPVDGQTIATVQTVTRTAYDAVISRAESAFLYWRTVPAPRRGEIVRQIGEALRIYKDDLGKLVSYEMGKSLQEGRGEVQEMIDICDFAVGLSRQLYGLSMHSERPCHRMYEQWHPLGIVGIISAFNFPVAVWSWNAMIALVCGNVCVWKPSEKTPLSAQACFRILSEVFKRNDLPGGLCNLVQGGKDPGAWMAGDPRVALVSATGSARMGKAVNTAVAARLGKCLLELGGNNAIIVSKDADLDMTLMGAVFGAVGTAGQRCTTTRRLIIHESVFDRFTEKLKGAYAQLKIGNPLEAQNHVGPLIDKDAVAHYTNALDTIKKEGGTFIVDGGVLEGAAYASGCYVKPCIAKVENRFSIVQTETFAPILYVMQYREIEEAIAMQNDVPQGLSSAIMTLNLREAELFLSAAGSDCGIANVNIGTSGAEIGGAFGGEKETGGGRESGSDAWKAYMRRQTNTINYGRDLPLAQGIEFNI
ncbi:L-piperidine-6-carboxylate dehydrogenase [Niabella drilacis]|uniref:aldehyde dehydrogenase (NAD(+)) n=1 Tax=Niabella drilacis (strain DSM 25811 / CCM 8410 / CCUG 62505 / LMG 26954 / E90) TaxID=1285928 RepID=A0A1G6R9B0_NIADE|nr:aldehyde dehydrogenase family protein [Niabella drilacis]SDD00617.1 aldehyde dehydrogenase (NAD+) [Niabella drilacis]